MNIYLVVAGFIFGLALGGAYIFSRKRVEPFPNTTADNWANAKAAKAATAEAIETARRSFRKEKMLFLVLCVLFATDFTFFVKDFVCQVVAITNTGNPAWPLMVMLLIAVFVFLRVDFLHSVIDGLQNASEGDIDSINKQLSKKEIGPIGLAYLEAMLKTGRTIPTKCEAELILGEAKAKQRSADDQKRRDDLVANVSQFNESK